MDRRHDLAWRISGIGASVAALIMLVAEHFIDHGLRLWPMEHHWLSEYVLSPSAAGRTLMHLAFVALAGTAISVAALSRGRTQRTLFAICAAGLAAMAFFNTDANLPTQPPGWPTPHGMIHQGCLYVAMSAGLVGMALHVLRPRRSSGDLAMFGLALVASIVQTALVAETQGRMTLYGGVTERIVVVSLLFWAIRFCASGRHLATNPIRSIPSPSTPFAQEVGNVDATFN